jgi:hypothetical protein
MYSGKGATQKQEIGYLPGGQGFLQDPQWHDRAPFFCRLTKDVDWVKHPKEAVIMYSWNEHSEGGGLCPTMGDPPAYKPVTTWLDEVAGALREWKHPGK